MAVNKPIRFASLTLDTISWTPVVPSMESVRMRFMNESAANIKLRSDAADAATERVLPPGEERNIGLQGFRHTPGVAFLWAQAASGTGPLLIDEEI